MNFTDGTPWSGWSPDEPLLAGKVAMIAGGGRGIGEATTRILSAAGAAVAVVDLEDDRAELANCRVDRALRGGFLA